MLSTEGQIVRAGHLSMPSVVLPQNLFSTRPLVCLPQRSSGHQKAPLASLRHSLGLPFGCLKEFF